MHMLTKELILFSPECNFMDISWWNNNRDLIKAFESRINWLYLEPARKLNEMESGFSSTLMTLCAIDSMIRLRKGSRTYSSDYEVWLRDFMPLIIEKCPNFYDIYRCGLAHEGRVKYGHVISYNFENKTLVEYHGKYVLNPERLLDDFDKWFECYISTLKNFNTFARFKNNLRDMLIEDNPGFELEKII